MNNKKDMMPKTGMNENGAGKSMEKKHTSPDYGKGSEKQAGSKQGTGSISSGMKHTSEKEKSEREKTDSSCGDKYCK